MAVVKRVVPRSQTKALTVVGRPAWPDDSPVLRALICDAPAGGCGGGARRAQLLLAVPGKDVSCPFCGSQMREASAATKKRLLAEELTKSKQAPAGAGGE
jgi:hypothetical protein